MYLIHGDAWAIVDTGVALPAADPRALSRRVLAEVPGFDDLDAVLLTHGHYDHVGGVDAVKEAFPVALTHLHQADADLAGHPAIQGEAMAAHARDWQLDEAVADTLIAHVGSAMSPVTADVSVDDADRIALGAGVTLDVVHLPGHTAGSVAYYMAGADILFAGDAVQGWGSRVGSWPLYFDPVGYRASLLRLLELSPAHMALAHGYHFGMPVNNLVLTGADVPRALEHSLKVVDQIGSAVSRVGKDASSPALSAAQGLVHGLLGEIPTLTEEHTSLPNHAGITLHAHGLGRATPSF